LISLREAVRKIKGLDWAISDENFLNAFKEFLFDNLEKLVNLVFESIDD
jgi:hypothetical protein